MCIRDRRNFLVGTVAISVAYAVFFSNLVLLPQWMQEYLDSCSVDAGLTTAPLGIFAVMLAPVMGKLMPRSDACVLATLAFLGFAAVFFMRSHYTTGVETYTLVVPTLLQGHSDRAVLRAAHGHHPVGPAAREDSGGGGPFELRARVRARGGHVARHDRLE